MSDTFQLLLTVLWLHTRETWLFHIMDALAPALWMVKSQSPNAHARVAEDATGATPRYLKAASLIGEFTVDVN